MKSQLFTRLLAWSIALVLLSNCAASQPPAPTAPPAPPVEEPTPSPLAESVPESQATLLPAEPPISDTGGSIIQPSQQITASQAISLSTIANLKQVAQIGLGRARAVALSEQHIFVATTDALVQYNLANFSYQSHKAFDGQITRLALSPDAKLLAIEYYAPSTSNLQTALYNADTLALIQTITGYTPVWSSDSQLLALENNATDQGNSSSLYQADGSLIAANLAGMSPSFSPDGSMLLTHVFSDSLGVQIYQTNNGSLLKQFPASSAAWSPDSRTLAISTNTGVQLYRMPNGDPLGELSKPDQEASDDTSIISFSSDGSRLYEIRHFDLRVWDLTNSDLLIDQPQALSPGFETDLISPISFSQNNALMVVFNQPIEGISYGLRLFRTDTLEQVYSDSESNSVTFNADASLAALISEEGVIRLIDTTSGSEKAFAMRGYSGIAFSPDSSQILLAGSEATIWNLANVSEDRVLNVPDQYSLYGLHHAEWSADGSKIAIQTSAGSEGFLFESLHRWELPAVLGQVVWESSESATDPIVLAFNAATGNSVSSYASPEATVQLGGAASFKFALEEPISALAFNSLGSQIVAADRAGNLQLHSSADGAKLLSFEAPTGLISQLVFSTDGELLAAYSTQENNSQPTLTVWRSNTAKPLLSLALEAPAQRFQFSSDNSLLLVAGDQALEVYGVSSGNKLFHNTSAASEVRISPDMRLIATVQREAVYLYALP
jgi:Tol biopolymer transport system component